MNRRWLTVIALLIALPLFAAPLVSPIPDQEPHLSVTSEDSGTEPIQYLETSVQYQNLSNPAQRILDKSFQDSTTVSVPLDEVPEPWASLAPDKRRGEATYLQAVRNGRYYEVRIERFLPQPPLPAVVLRLGPLAVAIALGDLAGYFFLTAED